MYRLSKDTILTPEMILAYINNYSSTVAKYEKLHRYYLGQHDILNRTMTEGKPNNRIPNPYPKFITDMYVGYMVGVPITYNAPDEAQEQLGLIQDCFNYNDEASENSELARDMSIFGVAVELLYTDEDSQIRFARLNPLEVIPIYDDTISGNLHTVIRYFDTSDIVNNNSKRTVEIYTADKIITYKVDGQALEFVSETQHFFKDVPVSIYLNNDEVQGDWECVIPLIDAMDAVTSDGVNEVQYMADAYLVATGFGEVDTGDGTIVNTMKNNRLLLLPDANSKAEWIVKNLNDSYIQNLKTRLDDAIHKFSLCPNLTDKEFSGVSSGVAMRYKILGFSNATDKKIRTFKKGLQRRIELITNIINEVQGSDYDYRNIDMTFTKNLPVSYTEQADLVTKLRGIISNETALSQLPFIGDVQAEMDKIANESSSAFDITAGDTNAQTI